MSDWQPIDTIPSGRIVKIKTTKGMECLAYVTGTLNKFPKKKVIRKADKYGPARINCTRYDGIKSGNVVAVVWKER